MLQILYKYLLGIFTFYPMEYNRWGRFPNHVYNPYGGWNFLIFYSKYKYLGYPFISYRCRAFKFSIGWRETGRFTIKII